jgi:hypothetical protein
VAAASPLASAIAGRLSSAITERRSGSDSAIPPSDPEPLDAGRLAGPDPGPTTSRATRRDRGRLGFIFDGDGGSDALLLTESDLSEAGVSWIRDPRRRLDRRWGTFLDAEFEADFVRSQVPAPSWIGGRECARELRVHGR